MTDVYKTQNNLAPPKMETMFERKTIPYNLRIPKEFVTQTNRTVSYGLKCLSNLLPQLWLLALYKYKQINF